MSTLIANTLQDVNTIKRDASTTAISIDSSGRTTFPQKIAFMAKLTSNFNPGTASRTKIPFATSHGSARAFDFGGGFDSTNNRFQAPIDGLYCFMASAYVASHNTSDYHIFRFTLNDNTTAIGEGYSIAVLNSGAYQSQHIHCLVNMTAGMQIDCRTQSAGDASYNIEYSNSHFSGYLIG